MSFNVVLLNVILLLHPTLLNVSPYILIVCAHNQFIPNALIVSARMQCTPMHCYWTPKLQQHAVL